MLNRLLLLFVACGGLVTVTTTVPETYGVAAFSLAPYVAPTGSVRHRVVSK